MVLLSCLGPMLGFVGLSLAHLGTMLPPPGCFGPTFTFFFLRWTILGRLGPMLAHLGTMLGVAEVNVAPSWLSVGLSGHPGTMLGPCWVLLGLLLGLCCAVVGLCRTKKGHQSAKKPVFHGIWSVFYT